MGAPGHPKHLQGQGNSEPWAGSDPYTRLVSLCSPLFLPQGQYSGMESTKRTQGAAVGLYPGISHLQIQHTPSAPASAQTSRNIFAQTWDVQQDTGTDERHRGEKAENISWIWRSRNSFVHLRGKLKSQKIILHLTYINSSHTATLICCSYWWF